MITANKGEWSEIYTFLKLLVDGRLYAADSELNKMENKFFPIVKIFKNRAGGNYQYIRRSSNIEVINGNNKEAVVTIPVKKIENAAEKLLRKIKNSKGTFNVPEVEAFLYEIKCYKVKAPSIDKSDITLVVRDLITGFKPTLGFSIKSKLGSAPTLLNASKSTNFIYEVKGKAFNAKMIRKINHIDSRSKIRERILAIERYGGKIKYLEMNKPVFKLNMQVIDSKMPRIMAKLLLYYYKGEKRNLSDLLKIIEKENPCGYDLKYHHGFYSYKLKTLLMDIALGMTPATVWQGRYDATGGYIVVRPDGEVVCYHIYNKNEFENYLLKKTGLDTPSSKRHKFGTLYKDKDDRLKIKLNMQIRFKR